MYDDQTMIHMLSLLLREVHNHDNQTLYLTQCWFNVGPTSQTVAQHRSNIRSMSKEVLLNMYFFSCHGANLMSFLDFKPLQRRDQLLSESHEKGSPRY